MPTITTRPATLQDAKALAQIHTTSWRAIYQNIIPQDYLDNMSADRQEALWRSRLQQANNHIWLAEQASLPVGYVAFGPPRDTGHNPAPPASTVEIYALYVLPDYWRKGVGHTLWQQVQRFLQQRNLTEVYLWVLAENHRARTFYTHCGFTQQPTTKTVTFGERALELIQLTLNSQESLSVARDLQ